MINTCGRCTTTWTGTRACHCAACHHTFVGVTAFDQHRRDHRCLIPGAESHAAGLAA